MLAEGLNSYVWSLRVFQRVQSFLEDYSQGCVRVCRWVTAVFAELGSDRQKMPLFAKLKTGNIAIWDLFKKSSQVLTGFTEKTC